ncbi:unnamed protein product [Rhizophagus irregularis]|nr:unnamed protein product [Rhizophagus irregularis]
MQYASGGDLYNILRKKFTKITWDKQKLNILWQISEGLETIHKSEFIHRDFHSGNILSNLSNGKRQQWQIGDLGLSQPVNNAQSNNEIYGVIPYVAPEIFKGCSSNFSKDYNSIELELDIDIKSSNILGTKRNIEELEINSYGNSGKHIKIKST